MSWADTYDRLSGLDHAGLVGHELEALADAAWMVCRLTESTKARQQAYVRYLKAGDDRPAARVAWRLFWEHLYGGESVVALGWLRRARRHLTQVPEAAEHGLLALADAELALNRGELDQAAACALRAVVLGERYGAQGIVALGLTVQGRVLIAMGSHDDGCGSLDEAMTLVLAGQLDDYFAGAVYCLVIAECQAIADIGRGSEWTDAARAWCASLPTTTPFHGICRIHRGEILCLRGMWEEAEREIRTAGEELAAFKPRSAAEAFYALGELRRRQGDLAAAEAAFSRSHELGRDPQPGLALVRIAQGQLVAAATALRVALVDASRAPMERARLLAAQVDAALAAGDLDLARSAAGELSSVADTLGRPAARAVAGRARGAVLLAAGNSSGALGDLRTARATWGDLGLPFEEAQARLLIASAMKTLGDEDGAIREIRTARATFERLGADAEARLAVAMLTPSRPAGLTPRELEVLGLVAAGSSNRDIATALVISEHTVARHVQNLFAKLGVSSRAAATAFAVEHQLAQGRGQNQPGAHRLTW